MFLDLGMDMHLFELRFGLRLHRTTREDETRFRFYKRRRASKAPQGLWGMGDAARRLRQASDWAAA
jgi:hypothetical protein